jgi:hypothetical protein
MEYKIIKFDKQTGQIIIQYADLAPIAIDIPLNEVTNEYLTGEEFNQYINGFIPTWHIERKEKISAGISNESQFLQFLKQHHNYEEIVKPSPSPETIKWVEIRDHRNLLLKITFDPKIPYIITGDIQGESLEKLKQYRQQLLDIPEVIQSQIDAGEFSSVLDVNIETYPWPELES